MAGIQQVITVSQINNYIRFMFEQDDNLRRLYIAGEISNFKKHYPSGHLYFSLKDSKSVIRAVMFSSQAKGVAFELKDGISVIVFGRISCYEATGQYQVYVERIQPEGIGSVYLAYEQLKSKLAGEGLFDDALKKPLPRYPKRIGVVTSRTGAVIHDIQTVAAKRYPLCEIMLYPTEVQGEKAEKEIVRGIEYFNREVKVDAIIVGRGGGSIEDLWAFNKESVARAVVASEVPIISAVGHETDFTICDFVADRRAATPSAAAEMALPDIEVVKVMLSDYATRIRNAVNYKISESERFLGSSVDALRICNIGRMIELNEVKLEQLVESVKVLCRKKIDKLESRYKVLERNLYSCSEQAVLRRGFVRMMSDRGRIISSVKDLADGMKVDINLADGRVSCRLGEIVVRSGKNGEEEANV